MRRFLSVLVIAATLGPCAFEATAQPVPANAAQASELRSELDRTRSLERELAQARADAAAARQALVELQGRRTEGSTTRPSPLVLGLSALVVLLLVAVVALSWRLSLDPRRRSGSAAMHATKASRVDPSYGDALSPRGAFQSRTPPPPQPADPFERDLLFAPAITTQPAARSTALRYSVDQLSELDRQADASIASGDDEAAIDLLMGHLRRSGGASPMPYLKLLDIYRRRGDSEAYERIRERFGRRFNCKSAPFAGEPVPGRPLDAYPGVIERLQACWAEPERAVAVLESLIGRSQAGDPGFDLPAFVELTLLHRVARDLRERDSGPEAVDLPLPLTADRRTAGGPPALDLQLP
jgi:hypothetical protein